VRKIERMIFPGGLELDSIRRGDSACELYRWLLDGPLEFRRRRPGSKVERRYSTIYDPTLEQIGVKKGFDRIFVGECPAACAVSSEGAERAGGDLPRELAPARFPIVDEVGWHSVGAYPFRRVILQARKPPF
jgi:hypothetical protein